jgi:hypothetical protein
MSISGDFTSLQLHDGIEKLLCLQSVGVQQQMVNNWLEGLVNTPPRPDGS